MPVLCGCSGNNSRRSRRSSSVTSIEFSTLFAQETQRSWSSTFTFCHTNGHQRTPTHSPTHASVHPSIRPSVVVVVSPGPDLTAPAMCALNGKAQNSPDSASHANPEWEQLKTRRPMDPAKHEMVEHVMVKNLHSFLLWTSNCTNPPASIHRNVFI